MENRSLDCAIALPNQRDRVPCVHALDGSRRSIGSLSIVRNFGRVIGPMKRKPLTVPTVDCGAVGKFSKARTIARRLDVCSKTIFRWADQGKITRHKINDRVVLFDEAEVAALIEDARVSPPSLGPEKSGLASLRLSLGEELRRQRLRLRYSQSELAHLVDSSEAQVAKLEAAESEVPLCLLFRALFAVGVKLRDVGRVLSAA